MSRSFLLVLFSSILLGHLSSGQDNRYQTTEGVPILLPAPTDVDILDAVYRSEDQQLLAAIGRKTDQREKSLPLPLVWNEPIALYDGKYQLCIFDSPGRSGFDAAPRVLLLLKHGPKGHEVVTWGEFGCSSGFAFASVVQPLSSQETHLVTINPSGRSGGELWFERYKIDPKGISRIGEGPNPSQIRE